MVPGRLVVGDVALRFGGVELSSVGNYSLPVVVGASPLFFRAVRLSSSLFRGCRRLGELGVAVLRHVVAGLAIVWEWTFCGHLSSLSRARPRLNTFPAGPRPVFSRGWLSFFPFQ